MVAAVPQPGRADVVERLGEPGRSVVVGTAWLCAEGDEVLLDVAVSTLVAADLLRGPGGQDGAVRQQGEGAGCGSAEVGGVGGQVQRSAMSREDGAPAGAAGDRVGERDDAAYAVLVGVGERAGDEPGLLAECKDSSETNGCVAVTAGLPCEGRRRCRALRPSLWPTGLRR